MKDIIRKILSFFNYAIVPNDYLKPIDKLGDTIQIRNVSYFFSNTGVLINANLNQGRGLPINSFGSTGNHPFSIAVKVSQGLKRADQMIKIESILFEYYERVNPINFSEMAGFEDPFKLSEFPPWAIVMPWQAEGPEEWSKHITHHVAGENGRYDKSATIENGWAWTGPVDENKCKIEASRLASVASSISSKGYLRNDSYDGDIKADILVNESNDWVWQSVSAQHRAAALSGLGYDNVPIRVRSIIRREEFEFWPNVCNKLYTKDEALWMFDTIFRGDFGFVTRNWDSYLKENRLHG